jgi:hypothetical protein
MPNKRPKIKVLSRKYNFSLNSMDEIENILEAFNIIGINDIDKSVIENYYKQRLPIETAKKYLKLDNNQCKSLTDSDIINIACIKHQKELLKNCYEKKCIKHIIDGMEYPCKITYNSSKCDCGVDGYIWSLPNEIEYEKSYWMQKEWEPMIHLKYEPHLNMVEEINVIEKYIRTTKITININKNMINQRVPWKRIHAYPYYYYKYWEWEHMEGENLPQNYDEWRKYFETSGCANHRDLIETIHMNYTKCKHPKIDYRYGVYIK